MRGAWCCLDAVHAALKRPSEAPLLLSVNDDVFTGKVPVVDRYFPEEERSRQPSLFSMVRAVVDMFAIERDPQVGLYGAFGYDLTFQFEPIRLAKERPESQRVMVLYLPHRVLLVVDKDKRSAWRLQYGFAWDGESTVGLAVGSAVAWACPSSLAFVYGRGKK